MFSIRIFGFQTDFQFGFFATVALFLLYDSTDLAIFGLLSCLLHELGHVFMMTLYDVPPKSLVFYGGGIKIAEREVDCLRLSKKAVVLLAGCVVNFILFAVCLWIADGSDLKILSFAYANLAIGILNLLPIGYFDGARLLEIGLLKICTPQRTFFILNTVRIIFSVIMLIIAVLMIFYSSVNLTSILLICYLLLTFVSD